jgi:hypothetical protein
MSHHSRARTDLLCAPPAAADPLEVASARITAETAIIRSIEPRADAQATGLFNHTATLLAAGLALVAAGRWHGPAAWTAVALLCGAVLLLGTALKSRFRGNVGFVRWAQLRPEQFVDALTAGPGFLSAAGCTEQAQQLQWLSRSLRRRFQLVHAARALLMLALTAAVLSAIGR